MQDGDEPTMVGITIIMALVWAVIMLVPAADWDPRQFMGLALLMIFLLFVRVVARERAR